MSAETVSVPTAQASELLKGNWRDVANSAIFNTMRILKRVNPGDTYYEQYLAKLSAEGTGFFDTYHLLWKIGTFEPKRILEIGMRTGISLCQLLSAVVDHSKIEKVVGVDPFDQFTSASLVLKNLLTLNIPLAKHGESGIVADQRLRIYALRSDDAFPMLIEKGETFDYILVDGDHSKAVARTDLESAHLLLERGGIIVFDDISTAPGECALLDVWESFEKEHEKEYSFAKNMTGKGVAWAIKL